MGHEHIGSANASAGGQRKFEDGRSEMEMCNHVVAKRDYAMGLAQGDARKEFITFGEICEIVAKIQTMLGSNYMAQGEFPCAKNGRTSNHSGSGRRGLVTVTA